MSDHLVSGHVFHSAKIKMVVIIYNFTKGHNISLRRCAPLLLSIILFPVINSSAINAECSKILEK